MTWLAGPGGKSAIAALKIGGQIADGRALVGGVEDEVALAVCALTIGQQAGIIYVGRNLDGGDHVIAVERRIVRIDDAAAIIHRNVVCIDAGDVQHGDQQGGLVFAVAVAIAKDVGGVIGLQPADSALNDEVADVFLDGIGDAAELGVEVRRAGDERLRIGSDLRRGLGPVRFERCDPLADGLPLVVSSIHGGVAPLHAHACRKGRPLGMRGNIAEIERGHVLHFPAPVVGDDLDSGQPT